jgi:hypothetical protein
VFRRAATFLNASGLPGGTNPWGNAAAARVLRFRQHRGEIEEFLVARGVGLEQRTGVAGRLHGCCVRRALRARARRMRKHDELHLVGALRVRGRRGQRQRGGEAEQQRGSFNAHGGRFQVGGRVRAAPARVGGRLQQVEEAMNPGETHLGVGQVQIESQFVLTVQPVLARFRLDQPDQRQRLDARIGTKQQAATGRIRLDPADAEARRALPDLGDAKQRVRRRRQRAEAVDQLHLQLLQRLAVRRAGDALVQHQAQVDVRHQVLRQQRGDAEFHLDAEVERTVEVGLLAGAQRLDGPLQHLQVHAEPDLVDLAALLVAQQLAGAADLQVVGREGEARAKVLQRLDGFQPLGRVGGHGLARWRHQVGVGAVMRASRPARVAGGAGRGRACRRAAR